MSQTIDNAICTMELWKANRESQIPLGRADHRLCPGRRQVWSGRRQVCLGHRLVCRLFLGLFRVADLSVQSRPV